MGKNSSVIWLIGNGPSLRETPFSLMKGDMMGVNKIGALGLPLTHYVKVDYSPFDGGDWRDEVLPFVNSGIPCLLWDVFRDGVKDPHEPFGDLIPEGIGDRPNVTWVTRCVHHGVPPIMPKAAQAWHEPFCTAYNSISIMAQWAVVLGYEEIRLVGCDGKFTDGTDDHFMPYYKRVDVGYKNRNNSHVFAAHQLIKGSCPIPVYDYTVSEGLGVFPKRGFE